MKNQPLLNSINSNNETKYNINNKDKNKLLNISSNYILKIIFLYIKYNTSLKLIKNNKSLQTKLGFNIENYKDYSDFEIKIERKKIVIKEAHFKSNDSGYPFVIFFSWCYPSSIYIFYIILYLLLLLILQVQTINTFIYITNICLIGLLIFSIFSYWMNYFNVINSTIEKYQLMLVAISILICVIEEILILVRLFILLKNIKAVNRRNAVLILDIIFLILNFIWIIIRSYHFSMFKQFEIVEKINKYYLKRYKNIYIKEYSLPNGFMKINKIKYIRNRAMNFEYLHSKEDLNVIRSINNLRINNNLKALKVRTNLPLDIINEPTKFIIYNYENIFHISDNKYLLKYKLGSFNFDFKNKNKEIMNILLNNKINTINIITQGKIQYILLYYDEFDI